MFNVEVRDYFIICYLLMFIVIPRRLFIEPKSVLLKTTNLFVTERSVTDILFLRRVRFEAQAFLYFKLDTVKIRCYTSNCNVDSVKMHCKDTL